MGAPRRTHCLHGHPLADGNLYLKLRKDMRDRDGRPLLVRACATCHRDRSRRASAARRMVAA